MRSNLSISPAMTLIHLVLAVTSVASAQDQAEALQRRTNALLAQAAMVMMTADVSKAIDQMQPASKDVDDLGNGQIRIRLKAAKLTQPQYVATVKKFCSIATGRHEEALKTVRALRVVNATDSAGWVFESPRHCDRLLGMSAAQAAVSVGELSHPWPERQ